MLSNPTGLYPYQVRNAAAVLESLRRYGAALDGSDTGTGKTYTLMAVARELNAAPVVVCPKAVIPSWERVAGELGGQCFAINYERLTAGKSDFGEMRNPPGLKEARKKVRDLQNELDEYRSYARVLAGEDDGGLSESEYKAICAKYPTGWYHAKNTEVLTAKQNLKKLNAQRVFTWDSQIPLIYFDEGHRCKGRGSLNSKVLVQAKKQGIPVVVASATAAKDPLEMYALGYALGLHCGSNFWQWAMKFGCEQGEHGGLVFHGGKPALKKLHALIYPSRGVRVTRDEIPDFPETQITPELYQLPDPDQLDALYTDMGAQLKALEAKRQGDRDLEHPLTQLLRDRQRIELLKVPLFVELAQDAIEEGMSVAIFVNFDETLREICARLSTTCTIDGSQVGDAGAKRRQANIDLFNSGEVSSIVCNTRAGGVGVSLHDTTGEHPRLALISPTFSAIDLIQVFGRVWRSGARSKSLQRIVLVKDTVEEQIHKKLKGKVNNISLINDGDLNPFF